MENIIKENEVSIGMYATLHDLSKSAVYDRCKRGSVVWRYLFPETEEYIVIEKDNYVQRKSGRKRK
jgi:hypothetical protein